MTPRLKERYLEQIVPRLTEALSIGNRLALPRLEKVILSVGMGKHLDGTKIKPEVKEQVLKDLATISGQKAVMVKARKSVANFKVREGIETHAMVTLRGDRMWEFLDRLLSLAIPRVRDFRGLPERSFDRGGNYAFGITEQGIFPEINMAEAKALHGLHVNIVIRNSDPQKSRLLLTELGLPFREPGASASQN